MPDKAPFTLAREELLERLKADGRFSDIVHWYEFANDLAERFEVEHSDCPFIAVVPRPTDEDEQTNAMSRIPQRVNVEIGTSGKNAEPIERLEWDFLQILRNSFREDHLGLAGEGLTAINIAGGRWIMDPGEDAPKPKWVVVNQLELVWRVI